MQIENLIKIASKSILKNRMRSLLTMLGIIIGVAAVIIMVAIGQGAQARILNNISSLGTNLLMVLPGASNMGGINRGAGSMGSLTLEDAERLAQDATLLAGVSPIVQTGAQIIGGGNNWNTSVTGVSVTYPRIRDWNLASGSFFTERDVKSRAKVAVLGQTVVDNLFPDQDPIGQLVRIRNVPFRVIGVLAAKGQDARGMDRDDIVLAPYTTVYYRLSGSQYIRMIMASAISTDQMNPAEEQITSLLRSYHRLSPGEEDDFRIRSQTEITQMVSETTNVLTMLLGSIAGVSLIVGGIGIMNIMLVSVTERTREIGLRLAVGARGMDVLTQFMVEAIVLSLIGGIIGILLGAGVSVGLRTFTQLTPKISPIFVLIAFCFSGAVGVFFGFYPARKASALNPIDALRYE
jgi:putative ABC transport system permease protein